MTKRTASTRPTKRAPYTEAASTPTKRAPYTAQAAPTTRTHKTTRTPDGLAGGRTEPSKWLQVRAAPELHEGLDVLRRAEPDMPDKSAMIRRLVERAIRRLVKMEERGR